MTAGAPDFTAAVRLVNGSGLDPMARAVLLAVLCEGIDIGAGRWAWVGTVAALAAASGVGLSAVKVRLGQLAEAGAMGSDPVAGMVAKTFDFATIGRVATEHGRVATAAGRLATADGRVAAESSASESIGRVATVDGRVATTAPDGTGLAIRAQAPARGSLLGSFQEPILARGEREVVVDLASASPRTHEAPPATSPTLHAAAGAPPSPMAHPMADDPSPEAEPGADDGRLACSAWERALGVTTLPGGHIDALRAAYDAHGLDVVTEAADRLAAYLADAPRSRAFALRQPRVIADRVADVLKARAAPAKGNPNLREMSTCPKFWAEQAAALSARLPAYTMPTPEELEQMPW